MPKADVGLGELLFLRGVEVIVDKAAYDGFDEIHIQPRMFCHSGDADGIGVGEITDLFEAIAFHDVAKKYTFWRAVGSIVRRNDGGNNLRERKVALKPYERKVSRITRSTNVQFVVFVTHYRLLAVRV